MTTQTTPRTGDESLLTGPLTDMAYQAITTGRIARANQPEIRADGSAEPSTSDPQDTGCSSTEQGQPGCEPEPQA